MQSISEYSAELQLQTFQINPENIKQPVLDIGCGQNYYLVNHLRALGVDAYGFDVYPFSEPYLQTTSWLEYNYGKDKWGTIISHFALTNPSIQGNLGQDNEIFNRILQSLKKEGSFYFTPEWWYYKEFVNEKHFQVTHFGVDDFDFKAVVIKKL